MKKTVMALAAATMMSMSASADDAKLKDTIEAKMKKVLGPRADVTEVVSLGEGQIYEVMMIDGSLMHMTPDLNYLIYQNTLYKFGKDGLDNVSDLRKVTRREAEMAAIPDSDTVLFPAKGDEKAVINVFTDIDCGYCQKLHREMEAINEKGITVRYLAYPRAGIFDQTGGYTESYRKINYVWCQAEDERASAMTDVKSLQSELSGAYSRVRNASAGSRESAMEAFDEKRSEMQELVGVSLCDSPVAAQFNVGRAIGVSGTPAIVTSDGELIPGYMEADKLAEKLGI
ncbi:DsbC family protein [Thalassolituus sp.]|uniref:DsbC family protein n=2 Tax=Thalassolituus sp. TaxID=2030822 RepID=UPI003511F33A